jgi:hypothetical protein
MILFTILCDPARSPGLNGRKRTRDGSGLRLASVRLTSIATLFMKSFIVNLFGPRDLGAINFRRLLFLNPK